MSINRKINEKRQIGFKKLTPADLGRASSHQTHIALFEAPLDWLLEKNLPHVVLELQFVHVSQLTFFKGPVDFIKSKETGLYRSPKLRTGMRNEEFNQPESLCRHIRNIVDKKSKELKDTEWYLFWASLDFSDQDMVFFLFHSEEDVFKTILNILPNSSSLFKRHIELDDTTKLKLINILESTLDKNTKNFLEDVEVENLSSQSEIAAKDNLNRVRPGFFNEQRDERIKFVGRRGEEFINEYLVRLESRFKIVSFKWVNKDEESGLPYDFEITLDKSNKIFCDVKSTGHENFRDGIIYLSRPEMKFINDCENYCIYRVYNVQEDSKSAYLRECIGVKAVSEEIYHKVFSLENSLGKHERIKFNLTLSPKHHKLIFGEEVNLYLEDS